MAKWPWQAVSVGLCIALLPALSVFAQGVDSTREEPEWLLNTLQDALDVADGDVLSLHHTLGDVRIKTADTNRLQVTAIAQYRADDPRVPKMHFVPSESGDHNGTHQLVIDFTHLEIAENEAWAKRRIDVGLLVPKGLRLEIETGDGLIEAKKIEARSDFRSARGAITYDGSGDLKAHSERGSVRAQLAKTGSRHSVALSSLTGDIRCILLEGANAQVEVSTRGPVTTDYSIKIDREVSSPLKNGRVKIGRGGSKISLKSYSGGVRLQGLIAPEKADGP